MCTTLVIMTSKALLSLPYSVQAGLRQLGADIRKARIRRRITLASMAERAFVSPGTVGEVEKGSPKVALGIYATILFVLGLHERIFALANPATDTIGEALMATSLPKRVRHPQKRPF